jgi:hypothetical protein
MKYIVTHPGGSHKDDFLASSLMIAETGIPIYRRDPTEQELKDPEVCVIDIGHEHDSELLNFDHHQFDVDHPPVCALTLVLQHLGIYKDARAFCPWLETAEWLDSRGVRNTAKWLNTDPFVVAQLSSPIDGAVLRFFSQETSLEPDHPIWQLMEQIGTSLLDYVRGLRKNLNLLGDHVEAWKVGDLTVYYLPREAGLADDVTSALDMYIRQQEEIISAKVYPDRRSAGYGLSRFDDDLRFDFTKVEAEADVHFAHRQGFIAKTTATDPARLKELLGQSKVPSPA